MNIQPVFLNIIIYIAYVMIPIIPAILIYRMFPKSSSEVDGMLSGLKIKAGGAFAAYVITVLLGYFIIKNNIDLVNQMADSVWTISSRVEFIDKGGVKQDIRESELQERLKISTAPKNIEFNGNYITIKTYTKFGEFPSIVNFSYEGYESYTRELDSTLAGRPSNHRKVDLGTIRLKKIDQEYDPDLFLPADPGLMPIPIGGPPVNEPN
jgi:hypothetical protein